MVFFTKEFHMLSQEILVNAGKGLPIQSIQCMGENATMAYIGKQDQIRTGKFVGNQRVQDSESVFSFQLLDDGTLVMGKVKGERQIFERYMMN